MGKRSKISLWRQWFEMRNKPNRNGGGMVGVKVRVSSAVERPSIYYISAKKNWIGENQNEFWRWILVFYGKINANADKRLQQIAQIFENNKK